MVHLSGLEVKDDNNPNGDIEIHYIGLRPGEKLFEELLISDNVSETERFRNGHKITNNIFIRDSYWTIFFNLFGE
jgi:FlaA1/EpsC-like NDP-sugar epimerase